MKNISISLEFNVLVCDSGKTSEQLEQLTLWQLPKNYHYIVEHKTLKPLLESDGFTPAKPQTCNNRIDSLAHFNAKAGKTGQELSFQTNQGFIMFHQVHPFTIREKGGSRVPYCQALQLSGELVP